MQAATSTQVASAALDAVRTDIDRLETEVSSLADAEQQLRASLAEGSARLLAQVAVHEAERQRLIAMVAAGRVHQAASDDLAARLSAVLPGVERASAEVAKAIGTVQAIEAAVAARMRELGRLRVEESALAAVARRAPPADFSPQTLH